MRETTFRSSDGTEIWARSIGAGPPMVLCDGIGCDQYVWKYAVEHFRHHFTVVRWNYRGHGRSAPPVDPDAVSVRHHALDLEGLLQHLDLREAILVGHSMGVQVILEHHGHHPERAAALIPTCGSYRHPLDTFRDSTLFRDGVFPTLYRVLTTRNSRLFDFWRRTFPSELAFRIACLAEINPRLVKREDFWPYLEHMAAMDPELFIRMLKSAGEHSAEHVLANIRVPTLIFAGAQDRFTPPWLSEQMAQLIPGAELCVIPGGTHTAPIEVPDLFNLRLEKFLKLHRLWPELSRAGAS
jgi:pimeloyl-ACP methyl ester carboxylesterase